MTRGGGAGRESTPIDGLGGWEGVRPTLWVRAGTAVAAIGYLAHLVSCLATRPIPIGDPVGEGITFAVCAVAFFLASRRPALAAGMVLVSVAAEVYAAMVVVPVEWVASTPVLPVLVLGCGIFFGARAAIGGAAAGIAAYPITLWIGGRIGPAAGGIPAPELSRMVVNVSAIAATGVMTWLALRTLARVHAEAEERRRLEIRLQHLQRLQVVGELAGVAAHDFRNILAIFQNAAGLLATAADPLARELAGDLARSTRSGQAITARLLSLARREEPLRSAIDVARAVEELGPMVTRLLGPRCSLAVAVDGPATAVADPGELEQVVLNLAANARDAMAGGGRVTLRTRTLAGAEAAALGSGLEAPRQVLVEVADQGFGIAPDLHERIFEPFMTTKPPGEGTGLGLATVRSIATAWGGQVALESEPGAGATFRVFLPEATGAVSAPAARAPAR